MTAPMTREQLGWIEDQVRHAANKASKRMQRRALMGFLILLFGIGFVQHDQRQRSTEARQAIIHSGDIVAVDACNRDYEVRLAIRGTLVAARAQALARYQRGEASYEGWLSAQAFYKEQLKRLDLPDCRYAAHVLSDDPDREQPPIPKPLYPGHDANR